MDVGDEVIVSDRIKDYIVKEGWHLNLSEYIGKKCRLMSIVGNRYFLMGYQRVFYVYEDCIYKHKEINVGDEVVVNDRLRGYVNDRGWSSIMLDFIGKTFIVKSFLDEDKCFLETSLGNYYVYIDCIDKEEDNNNIYNIRWF